MKIARSVLNVVAIVGITWMLVQLFGSIQFTPWATGLLVRFASFFGVYGAENVEDFYMTSTLLLSLVLACAVVWSGNRILKRRPQ